MSKPIIIQHRPISQALQDLINEHNARVECIWLTVGSRCKPANAKRAAHGMAALSELLAPEGRVEPPQRRSVRQL